MMSQILFTVCFGALAGWFTAALSAKKNKMAVFTHVLFGVMGALIGLAIFQRYVHTTITGRDLYALVLSLVSSLTVIMIGRNFMRN